MPVLVPFGSVWRVLIVTSWFSLAYLSGYQLVQSGVPVLVPVWRACLNWYQLVQSGVPVLVPVGSVWRACLGTDWFSLAGVPVS